MAPVCNGTLYSSPTDAWAGEYSNVTVTAGNTYTFSSSLAADYLTISDANGTVAYTFGTGPRNLGSHLHGYSAFLHACQWSCNLWFEYN